MIKQLNLRTGRAVWSAYRAPSVPTETLIRDIKTDILVVGMGISGAMIVEQLTAAGHAVVAIDRRGPIKGSTAATTALVQFEIDQPLTMLSSRLGARQGRARLAALAPRSLQFEGPHRRVADRLRLRAPPLALSGGQSAFRGGPSRGGRTTDAGRALRNLSDAIRALASATASTAPARSSATTIWRSIRASSPPGCSSGRSNARRDCSRRSKRRRSPMARTASA